MAVAEKSVAKTAAKPGRAPAPKPRARRTKVEQRADKMEQILDAAEHLFSQHGLYGVTLKDVAQRVGVHHTLLNYYFTDKKKLFDDVIARRAGITSAKRMEALNAYDAATKGKPTVEGALRAFLDTDLDLYSQGGEAWKNYGALGALASNTTYGAELMDFHFDPVVLRIMDAARMLQLVGSFALVPQLPPLAESLAPIRDQWRTMPMAGGIA